jgi:hypothetical protein
MENARFSPVTVLRSPRTDAGAILTTGRLEVQDALEFCDGLRQFA